MVTNRRRDLLMQWQWSIQVLEIGSMRLFRKSYELGASGCWIQVQHRKDAVEYAVFGINRVHDHNVQSFKSDHLFREMESTMRDWVIETLYQGAYMREYHLWEKDCKEYFSAMGERNGVVCELKTNAFPSQVAKALDAFSIVIPADAFDAIREMNRRANIMKHEPGLTINHFIAEADYEAAVGAIERFWETLIAVEEVDYW